MKSVATLSIDPAAELRPCWSCQFPTVGETPTGQPASLP
jgi:hypothetical protein